ncbi:RNA polymerase sigma factor [Geomesophilobacter sediminis]|nr:RNA polymerase sigma factor [Geomesophilobacter sediminis]
MNTFLAAVERKAFRMAAVACSNDDEALDIVQDSMLAFVRKYRTHPAGEWSPLFYRVLQSRITDWHRRSTVRNRVRSWLGFGNDDNDDSDPLENVPDRETLHPDRLFEDGQLAAALEKALRTLPLRQQQAFLMRAWEGLDTRETAVAMGCSEGSVKTHYFRALQALRGHLEEYR